MPNPQEGALDQVDRKIHLYSDWTLSVGEAKSLFAKGAALNKTLAHCRTAVAIQGAEDASSSALILSLRR
jgi:hypothetical protein